MLNRIAILTVALATAALPRCSGTPVANLNATPSDLNVPQAEEGNPASGRRVWQSSPGFEDWSVRHALYLPTDWTPQGKYPVLVEYPGNGGYANRYGDSCQGRVEDCKLGYGMSGGVRFIWVSLPFLDATTKSHATKWWGDPDLTATYCRTTVALVCREYGGDAERVVLCGFSRGAIACGYIGLRDDETAKLWRAMVIHSHYDGVRRWGYPQDDAQSARIRLARFAGRPQFVTQENSVDDIAEFLKGTQVVAELLRLPYPNHTDEWVLKEIPERDELRRWLARILH